MDLLRVHSQDLHEHIAQEVGECLESGAYTDLAVRCAQGQTLHAHKVVMAAVSPYLQMLLQQNEFEEIQTIEMPEITSEEMQMLLEVVYNGVVEATIEDLRKLILLAHRLYINIPLSNELMQGLELKLPPRPPFKKQPSYLLHPNNNGHHRATPPKMPPLKLNPPFNLSPLPSSVLGGVGGGSSGNHATSSLRPASSSPSNGGGNSSADHFGNNAKKPKLNIDPTTMTAVLAHSQNNEHVCPICNSKYSNVGNFKQHMKTHDNEELREQRNAILSEMIATCFNPQTSLYTCHVCNSNYNHSGNFKQHLLKHERESGSISATLVAQAGSNPHLTNVLQSAMADRVDSGDKPAVNLYQYQCEHCDRSFKHPGNYKQHLASHMRNSNTASAANASSISNTLNKVNSMFGQLQHPSPPSIAAVSKLDSSMQMVACPECHLEFPGIDLLQAHISVSHKHLDVKLPTGTVLPNTPAEETSTNNGDRPSWHAALEESWEPYKCTVCNKGFQKMSKLTAHMKIHRAPEEHYNHPCDICGKKFTRPQHVARHKMLHTGERPFKCPKCPRQFTREDKLRHHLNESECGGGPGTGTGENSPNESNNHPVSSSSMGMQFGSLWGGTNGDMLANMYNTNDNSNADEHDEEMEHVTSDASNDSNSNMQGGGLTAAATGAVAAALAGSD